ncbi:MAG: NYN domain-containing protein [Ignavibacteriales bacterium]
MEDPYDVAVLVSGDNDFVPVVEAVKDQGKIVEVAFPRVAQALENAADTYIVLDRDYLKDCWLEK